MKKIASANSSCVITAGILGAITAGILGAITAKVLGTFDGYIFKEFDEYIFEILSRVITLIISGMILGAIFGECLGSYVEEFFETKFRKFFGKNVIILICTTFAGMTGGMIALIFLIFLSKDDGDFVTVIFLVGLGITLAYIFEIFTLEIFRKIWVKIFEIIIIIISVVVFLWFFRTVFEKIPYLFP